VSDNHEPAVVVRNVGKTFHLAAGRPRNIKDAVIDRRRIRTDVFEALHDVSLVVPKGSTYALVGHNGSGKSTLLKLMAGIHPPTTGSVTTNGRVSALLELGAGFHPDLTGRENVYLNGSIIGLSGKQVERHVDAIAEFAGIGAFMDEPVKIYSSGMFVRLGFSVAVHLDPEILIVDEVIAVGDEEFQRRCFDHLYKLRKRGVTILFVSHSLGLVEQLADEAAWIDEGRLRFSGPPRQVIDGYVGQVNAHERAQHSAEALAATAASTASPTAAAPAGGVDAPRSDELDADEGGSELEQSVGAGRRGTGEAQVTGLDFLDHTGERTKVVEFGEPFAVRLHYRTSEPLESPTFGLSFFSDQGWPIAGPNTRVGELETGVVDGAGHIDFSIDSCRFVPGHLNVSAAISDHSGTHVFDWHDREYEVQILPGRGFPVTGMVEVPGTWSGPVPE
jgi:ABC-2 type transport system ATP-binding protein/lipopolysaccharide transport system ATP-binding protein